MFSGPIENQFSSSEMPVTSAPQSLPDLIAALRAGELQEHLVPGVELKGQWAENHGPKLSALANRIDLDFRWLIVGVNGNGSLVGKDEAWAMGTEEIVSQHINAHLDPVQACTGISTAEVDGSWIVVVSVGNPGDVVYWKSDAYGAAGTTIIKLEPDEVLKLRLQLPGLTDYSAQPATSEYDPALVGEFARRVRTRGHKTEYAEESGSEEDILNKLGVRNRQVARILFGDCAYRVVRYDSEGNPTSNVKLRGLFGILTPEFAEQVQVWAGGGRECDRQPYMDRALGEALANAVAHAAYFEGDGDIIVELHPGHITIGNLCLRESTYFANRWFSRSHKTVNALLMEVLRIAGLVDELGRGKNLIFSESIRGGKNPPEVVIERAGKFDRWKLTLHGSMADAAMLRLLERSKAIYKDEQKALIAQALVLWRDRPVAQIRDHVDGDFARQFAEVLSSMGGPIFYWAEKDQITLTRWARVLIGEGKDSKALSPGEEANLQKFAFDMQTKHNDGHITPKDLRRLGSMGNTKSEGVLSSNILSRWEKKKIVKRVGHGRYRFVTQTPPVDIFADLMKMFQKGPLPPPPPTHKSAGK